MAEVCEGCNDIMKSGFDARNGGGEMIENTKCECGHNNPIGTILCEYCGRPLQQEVIEKSSFDKEMSYEGKARRSQLNPRSLFDQIWAFFSSVKVAIALIVITLIVSGIGTIFPQEEFVGAAEKALYYEEEYGYLGKLFYQLGFSRMYSEWWFAILVSMIGISLVICSLDRVVPLYRALKNQKVIKDVEFMKRQRIALTESVPKEEQEAKLIALEKELQNQHYQVRREGSALLAEKGRFSRWGPYINHIGLILLLFGILLRYIPGWNLSEFVWVKEGQTAKIDQTEYYVKNEKAFVEFYTKDELPSKQKNMTGMVKKYQTNAILYKKDPKTGQLKEVTKHAIQVNDPLSYDGLNLFQQEFRPNDVKGIKLKVVDKGTQEQKGTFVVDFDDISLNKVYQVGNNIQIRILEYYPDFTVENGRPATKSQSPNQPAFIFSLQEKGKPEEKSWVISGMKFENPQTNIYDIKLAGFDMTNASGLLVRQEKSLWIYMLGGIIFMIGVTMGSYWQHRRVWARVQDGELYIGAHTNKNWFGLRRELQKIGTPLGYSFELVEE